MRENDPKSPVILGGLEFFKFFENFQRAVVSDELEKGPIKSEESEKYSEYSSRRTHWRRFEAVFSLY